MVSRASQITPNYAHAAASPRREPPSQGEAARLPASVPSTSRSRPAWRTNSCGDPPWNSSGPPGSQVCQDHCKAAGPGVNHAPAHARAAHEQRLPLLQEQGLWISGGVQEIIGTTTLAVQRSTLTLHVRARGSARTAAVAHAD